MNCRSLQFLWRGHPGRLQQAALALVILLAMTGATWAQGPGTHGEAAEHAVVNFAELARQQAANPPGPREQITIPFLTGKSKRPLPPAPEGQVKSAPPSADMGLPAPQLPSPAPAESFAALGDDDTKIPPDTMGAAGPNHLMVTLNSQIRTSDRSGNAPSTVTLESFWTSRLTVVSGVFDPKLTYDPFNGRWIFAAVSNRNSTNSSVLIAVSQTNDPTGNWDAFRIDADGSNSNWADYPLLGFNKKWIVVAVNMYNVSTNALATNPTRIFAFSKAALYANPASAPFFPQDTPAFSQAPAVTYDNNLETMYLVDMLDGNIGGFGKLVISTITGLVGSETYTDHIFFPAVNQPWADGPPAMADFAPQLGTNQQCSTQKIQNGDSRMQNLVYREGSLWGAHNVFLPAATPTRTAAQWWELKTDDGTFKQFGRIDDATGTVFYAYPSIAVNIQKDVTLGFSFFSCSIYASAGYASRSVLDPLSTMRTPALLKAGEAPYYDRGTGPDNRWGDYSATVVDPVNDLDFWTIQEYASTPGDTDRWGTWWGKLNPALKKRQSQLVSE
ncbi:MAG: hypothetical protein HY651_07325 [Acidobacteria bacterium]|nr:hypothetical protein [Acidobacteriota bacterium]